MEISNNSTVVVEGPHLNLENFEQQNGLIVSATFGNGKFELEIVVFAGNVHGFYS